MGFFSNRSVRTRLLAGVALPLAGLLILISILLAGEVNQVRAFGEVRDVAAIAAPIGSLVHELQKERGASAGFLGSDGQQFGAELADQQNLTDAERELFAAAARQQLATSTSQIQFQVDEALRTAGSL